MDLSVYNWCNLERISIDDIYKSITKILQVSKSQIRLLILPLMNFISKLNLQCFVCGYFWTWVQIPAVPPLIEQMTIRQKVLSFFVFKRIRQNLTHLQKNNKSLFQKQEAIFIYDKSTRKTSLLVSAKKCGLKRKIIFH